MIKIFLISLLCLVPQILMAQAKLSDWAVEAESHESKVCLTSDGTIDIIAPKGLTLWYKRPMQGNVVIEYDARIVVEEHNNNAWNRLSDLNCFWQATDPKQKDGNVLKGISRRKGIFINQYALLLYYMGYGGNYNSTTRFRRYNGDEKGINDPSRRPAILREYTDPGNILKPNHWYHIRLEQCFGRVRYVIDGKCLVDYLDIHPFHRGYFGFRTTLAHAQIRNFTYSEAPVSGTPVALHWVGKRPNSSASPQTFGVPFLQGEVYPDQSILLQTDKGTQIPNDSWTLAYWPDGSVKWKAVAGIVPANTNSILLTLGNTRKKAKGIQHFLTEKSDEIVINTIGSKVFISKNGDCIIDSIVTEGVKSCGKVWLEANGKILKPEKVNIERCGNNRSTIKIDGEKFTLRLYAYKGSDEIKIVHTLLVDNELNAKGLKSLGLRTAVPMRSADYQRTIAFAKGESFPANSVLSSFRESQINKECATKSNFTDNYQIFKVKPLISRRSINVDSIGRIADEKSRWLASQLAAWDGFRLSQISPNSYSIRKRATSVSPWIGTIEGRRAKGEVILGDGKTAIKLRMHDFWQSYPSTIQIDKARSNEAIATMWMWSPEAEAKSFEHYDTIAHSLEAAYEDVQPGMSTAEGIARTSILYLTPSIGKVECLMDDSETTALVPTPEYLHSRKAFGIWSLPNGDNTDKTLREIMDLYASEQESNSWYGFFDYGDVMHTYDFSRGQWRYDVGGYAWDNTELASNAMFWYNFLREGREQDWRLAVAITRHTSEVDCYHSGPHAGLGSRHNVCHWGCGAKEARISQAFWNRFLYYLTADERMGDLMSEVTDADTLLYHLDPMRLAQPRNDRFPCTAPARLRIGPDWMAYAGNWFAEWERTGKRKYYDKIIAGMKSIANLPHGLFSGPKALGYDPATGEISWEGDTALQNTNHLLSIMGGFEMMNEMLLSIDYEPWNKVWLDHATHYKAKAWGISKNKFKVPRLQGYSYWKTGNRMVLDNAKKDMLITPFDSKGVFSTNSCATWSLDAIFLKEVAR